VLNRTHPRLLQADWKIAWANTYRNPVAKMAKIPNFFFMGTCNFKIDGMGSTKIAKSDMTLNNPVACIEASRLKQEPVVINRFQYFSRGRHINILKPISTR
jgi:hypothetical protein